MNEHLADEYRAGLRAILRESGKAVKVDERQKEKYPHQPEYWVSFYGWEDYDATSHMHVPTEQERAQWPDVDEHYHGCGLIIPEGATVEEVSYGEFAGTGVDADGAVGINAYGGPEGSPTELRCSCGRYRALTIRWEGSMHEALSRILGLPARVTFTI